MLGTQQCPKRKYINDRCQYQSTRGNVMTKTKNGNLKPVEFASRYLLDTEKKNAINELELLAVVWGPEHFDYTYTGSLLNY